MLWKGPDICLKSNEIADGLNTKIHKSWRSFTSIIYGDLLLCNSYS